MQSEDSIVLAVSQSSRVVNFYVLKQMEFMIETTAGTSTFFAVTAIFSHAKIETIH